MFQDIALVLNVELSSVCLDWGCAQGHIVDRKRDHDPDFYSSARAMSRILVGQSSVLRCMKGKCENSEGLLFVCVSRERKNQCQLLGAFCCNPAFARGAQRCMAINADRYASSIYDQLLRCGSAQPSQLFG
jgi:hypothetical protein